MIKCKIKDCPNQQVAKRLCSNHYQQSRKPKANDKEKQDETNHVVTFSVTDNDFAILTAMVSSGNYNNMNHLLRYLLELGFLAHKEINKKP